MTLEHSASLGIVRVLTFGDPIFVVNPLHLPISPRVEGKTLGHFSPLRWRANHGSCWRRLEVDPLSPRPRPEDYRKSESHNGQEKFAVGINTIRQNVAHEEIVERRPVRLHRDDPPVLVLVVPRQAEPAAHAGGGRGRPPLV